MNQGLLLRLTVALAALCLLAGFGAFGWQLYEAYRIDQHRESRRVYQETMAERCEKAPNFPVCVSNNEFVLEQLQGLVRAGEHRARAEQILPWAVLSPIAVWVFFFVLRWIATGRIGLKGLRGDQSSGKIP